MPTPAIVKVPQLDPGRAADEIDNRRVDNAAGTGGKASRQVTVLGGTVGDDTIEPLATAPVGTERALPVRQAGTAAVSLRPSANAAVRTVVTASQSSVLFFAADPTRMMALIFNDSNSGIFVGLGSAPVTADDYTYFIASSTLWEVPEEFASGEVHGMWSESEGKARLTALKIS